MDVKFSSIIADIIGAIACISGAIALMIEGIARGNFAAFIGSISLALFSLCWIIRILRNAAKYEKTYKLTSRTMSIRSDELVCLLICDESGNIVPWIGFAEDVPEEYRKYKLAHVLCAVPQDVLFQMAAQGADIEDNK